jgi:hypothetical protein
MVGVGWWVWWMGGWAVGRCGGCPVVWIASDEFVVI